MDYRFKRLQHGARFSPENKKEAGPSPSSLLLEENGLSFPFVSSCKKLCNLAGFASNGIILVSSVSDIHEFWGIVP